MLRGPGSVRGRLAAAAVTSAAAAAALAACSSSPPPPAPTLTPVSPSPGTTPPTTPSTPTGDATATPPTSGATAAQVPAAARANTAAGAEAFARYYFDALNAAFTTPDPGRLHGLADDSCRPCAAFQAATAALARSGYHVEPTPYSPQLFQELPDSTPAARVFLLVVAQPPTTTRRSDGSTVSRTPAARQATEILVARDGETWKVKDIAKARGVGG